VGQNQIGGGVFIIFWKCIF